MLHCACADALSKGGGGFGDGLVLFAAPAADTDGAYYLAGMPQWDSSRENHDPAQALALPAATTRFASSRETDA
ncbi:hypothetical protein MSG_03494 [Mycobacterium shigaense]|uniref:Uncharacterized protein n=1 Tax=Mycobacterium shigaense TaxID=722731 RepID=A0A1Z4EL36_9MYCO|nr:hypothetical protein MSG_03494 [Mycobacterium shigaense]